MKLIDKDALVAEIDNLLDKGRYHDDYDCVFRDGNNAALYALKEHINTLEVKEVDLDGISRHYALNNSPWDDCRDEIQDAYKAGFELGMQVSNKAQKGEEV